MLSKHISGLNTTIVLLMVILLFSMIESAMAQDWPLWGGSNARNNTPTGKNILTDWDVGTYDEKSRIWSHQKNIRWIVSVGSSTYRSPIISGGKIFIGGNNGVSYDPRYPSYLMNDAIDLGCLFCFDEQTGKFLWQHSNRKLKAGRVHDYPSVGLCSTPCVEGDRLWYVSNRGEVICLDTNGFHDDENDGPFQKEESTNKEAADVIWKLDMIRELGVFPHYMSTSSPLCVGETLFLITSNGVNLSETEVPAPDAPSFLALDRNSGKVLWSDNSFGKNILQGQWSSPAFAVIKGVPQVLFPGGDGWLYSFDPKGDSKGNSKLLWKFDCNPKESKWGLGGKGNRNNLAGIPVIYDSKVYLAVGRDPEHGEGAGLLWCVDPTKRGDVSPRLAVDREGNRIPHRRIQAVDANKGGAGDSKS